jgi:hypothetical protein
MARRGRQVVTVIAASLAAVPGTDGLRSAHRGSIIADYRNDDDGFRVGRTLTP